MSTSRVEFYMLGRRFELACDAGQEGRLSSLAQDLRRRIDDLYAANPAARTMQSEMQLLVMAAIGYADLWQDAETQRRQLSAHIERSGSPAVVTTAADNDGEAAAILIEKLAEELENHAEALENLAMMA